ncbi:MAG: purine-nucleoside phosphorylase [Melioribacteraceae bacterium]|nr:purine-nucleoside phosphorylase [Melioribacteraceae bacterium]MCF8352838.1 purine-nucleoside phosphorylase [Melioribacteraceae bacterium]MCF8393442.1 purine-nucleoside phosphorylase [Melioribacteraceae bacterium]MCF8417355.1 purine-nucleoside phosphorylase [Melioribacteraceae bacterium]
MKIDLNYKYKDLLDILNHEAPFKPDIALILGSGLGDFANSIDKIKSISTTELPGYPKSTVEGHEGFIHFAEYKGKNVIAFQGRIHFYEGYKLNECILPVFITLNLGCPRLIITNAAGGVNTGLNPGDLMLNTSFNSFYMKKEISELIGISSIEAHDNLIKLPDEQLNSLVRKASLMEGIFLKEGSYWIGKGPSYETPAEIKLVANNFGDAVGMSTVHEAIFAATKGIRVAAISCITNYAAGISRQKLSHQEVMDTANEVKENFERLIKRVIELI